MSIKTAREIKEIADRATYQFMVSQQEKTDFVVKTLVGVFESCAKKGNLSCRLQAFNVEEDGSYNIIAEGQAFRIKDSNQLNLVADAMRVLGYQTELRMDEVDEKNRPLLSLYICWDVPENS